MQRVFTPALLLLVISATGARAGSLDLRDWQDWYDKAASAVQSLLSAQRPDREVIAPPQDFDSKMVMVPPPAGSRMPIIRPRPEH